MRLKNNKMLKQIYFFICHYNFDLIDEFMKSQKIGYLYQLSLTAEKLYNYYQNIYETRQNNNIKLSHYYTLNSKFILINTRLINIKFLAKTSFLHKNFLKAINK